MKGLLLLFISFQLMAQGQVLPNGQVQGQGKPQTPTPAPTVNSTAPTAQPPVQTQNADPGTDKRSGLLFRPSTIDFQLNSGQTGIGKVVITNFLSTKKQFRIYVDDFVRDSAGGHTYSAGGSIPQSCAKWIQLDRTFFELDTGQTIEIPFKVVAPPDSLSNIEMKWAMLFFETTQEQIVEDAKGVKTTVMGRLRIGVHIYQTSPSITDKDITIEGFKLPTDSNRTCVITCRNTGKTQLLVKSYIELSNTATNERTKLNFPLFPMFPGQKRVLPFQLPNNLPKGKYSLIGVIDAGGDVPIAAVQENIDI
ncbi:MAG: hypothetical protein JO154_01740 [Chitinophaga sp.]|uniref:hypothetical protein n=1 Tax=Chitinophaga sp. TaxID=1869181 RepID=UPI0025C58B6D|nr:hypothetical protein [Chitinophaga sp.]MBV8251301.1 hypothetical protein [Chitinophaga sp.]